jgi:hypothetical protein
MGTVLLNSAGMPEPSPEISRRLTAISPGLHLRFLGSTGQHWAVCQTWDANNTGWARIQSGEVNPDRAFDIIGYLPVDCPVEQAPALLERMLRTYPKEDVRNMADAVYAYNETTPAAQAVEQAIAEVLDRPDPTMAKRPRGRPKKNA